MFTELEPRSDLKATGIPWVPQVPREWKNVRNKSILFERKEIVGSASGSQQLLALTKAGIVTRDINNLEGKVPATFDTYQYLEKDDLVFCLFDIDETPRTVGLVPREGMITNAYTRFRVGGDVEPSFLLHFYAALDDRKALRLLYTGLRKSIRTDALLAVETPLPSLREQAAIVKYLRHAHARIDRAIVAKRKLAALLEEQKQAIIRQAVTRGLDPSAPLKESGIPWLGEIPAHWELAPTRAALRLTKEVVGEKHANHVLLSLTLGGVIVRDLGNLKGKFAADQSSYQRVKPGQFVFCLFDVDETPRTIGLSRVNGMITGAYRVFDCSAELAAYVELYFLSMDALKSFRPMYSGLRKTIPVNALLQSKMPFPPSGERAQIVEQVRLQIDSSDQLRSRTVREIELLLEFRARLTSDVVTGQVDVRDIAAALPEVTAAALNHSDDESDDDAEELIEPELDLASADE